MTGGVVAVVTGAASGIGAAVARELAAPGARLVLGTLPGEALDAVLADTAAAGAESVAVEADVRDAGQAAGLAAAAEQRFGRIDLLVAHVPASPIAARWPKAIPSAGAPWSRRTCSARPTARAASCPRCSGRAPVTSC